MPTSLASRVVVVVGCLSAVGLVQASSSIGRSQGQPAAAQAPQFGGSYSGLDPRRQKLVDDWVARFSEVVGHKLAPEPFYDEQIALSQKTTFDAITYALMTTPLTDDGGSKFGDALAIVQRVDAVRGQVIGAAGDRQFRMYVRLVPGAAGLLERSREFARGVDNTVYHKGYPTNYREQGGTPSIQVSMTLDGARADIDVDYRSSSFPAAIFNGHLTSSNSDVRAGNNYERHVGRWAGFQNWWRGFFGVRSSSELATKPEAVGLPDKPRAGDATIDVMMNDFMKAWLVDGDAIAAMGYVSERAYACLAQDLEDPSAFDRGMAPYELLKRLKSAHDTLGPHSSLDGLTVGVRLGFSALKVFRQPHHARFVIYSVPDDIASRFDCESRLTLGKPKVADRQYGNYFGASFYVNTPAGGRNQSMALLWAKDNGYWKIVSWQTEPVREPGEETDLGPELTRPPTLKADPTLVLAAKSFLENWLIKKEYDAAFGYLSTRAYPCYDVVRSPEAPASTSPDDAGRKIRAGLERSGSTVPKATSLSALVAAVQPIHPAVRPMSHIYSKAFTLTSVPDPVMDAFDCAARARGDHFKGELKGDYGKAFGMNFRFLTRGGDAPVLRILWTKEANAWRIISYDIEQP